MKIKNLKNLLLIFLALLAIFQFANQRVTIDRITRSQEQQVNALKLVQEENQRLLDEVKNLNSADYIEKQARERLQMIKPDEIPVIDTPGGSTTPVQTTAPGTQSSTKP